MNNFFFLFHTLCMWSYFLAVYSSVLDTESTDFSALPVDSSDFIIFWVWLQAALVFILYVRCTAINPADPGIMSKFDSRRPRNGSAKKHGLSADDLPQKFDELSIGERSSLSSTSIAIANSNNKPSFEALRTNGEGSSPNTKSSFWKPGKIFCAVCVHEDCRKQEGTAEQEGTGEDALFCTLCNAEVVI